MSNTLVQQSKLTISLVDYITSKSELTRKNEASRIRLFESWLANNDCSLFDADLAAYRDYLLGSERGLKPTSVNAHLKSIRSRYRAMMRSNSYRDALGTIAIQMADRNNMPINSIADQLAIVNELEKRLENQIFSDDVFAREIVIQDIVDESNGVRLSEAQALQLIRMPGLRSMRGIRDTALLALMLCTGIREHEAVAIAVDDLRAHYQRQLALRIREGKGAMQRVVVYGTLSWCLEYVELWLREANITQGAVFRGFWGNSESIRPTAMTVRTINRILERYPVYNGGHSVTVKPHDLRRTYARIQFNSGMQPEALQQNMGHASYDTTLGYIGDLDAEKRGSRAAMPPPHTPMELKQINKDK